MNYNKKTLGLTIACLLGTATLSTNAAIITLDISGTTATTAGSFSTSDSDSSSTSMSANSTAFDDFSYSNANARGDDTGWFYSTASANNNATAKSTVSQTYNVTNDSNDDQFFDFSFEVMNGGINASCGGNFFEEEVDVAFFDGYGYGECSGNDFATSSYMAEILFNGSSIWNSSAEITEDANGAVTTTSGAMFDNTFSSSNYFGWGTTSFNIDLGLIDANSDFVLEYLITTESTSVSDNFGSFTNAYSQFGDPNGFSASNNTFTQQSASVPLPATLGLLGLGIAGLGFSRRKNK